MIKVVDVLDNNKINNIEIRFLPNFWKKHELSKVYKSHFLNNNWVYNCVSFALINSEFSVINYRMNDFTRLGRLDFMELFGYRMFDLNKDIGFSITNGQLGLKRDKKFIINDPNFNDLYLENYNQWTLDKVIYSELWKRKDDKFLWNYLKNKEKKLFRSVIINSLN